MDPQLSAICRHHGVFLRREAAALGYRDDQIASQVRKGLLHRVRHGAYTLSELWPTEPMAQHLLRSRAAYRTAQAEVVLSHTSSLAVHAEDWWDLPLLDVHLTRLDGRVGRRSAGVTQHCGMVLDEDIEYDGELRFMSATRTALEITTIADVEHALVVVNALLHAGRTTNERLQHRYVGMEMWPRTLRTDVVLRLCNDRVESVGESRSEFLFFSQGLPRPVSQLVIHDHSGHVVARLDFAWPHLGVWVEFDGRVKYDRLRRAGETEIDVLMREKRREERIREITGWECIHLTWADLAHPARTAARIRAAMVRGSRRA